MIIKTIILDLSASLIGNYVAVTPSDVDGDENVFVFKKNYFNKIILSQNFL